ncbi:MAG: rhomboid family intramembrane serine protease [Paludibacteraceae bacterium]|nr:rhomboid family intramembrane serine protease [Paludibacteraceae bacterium]
MNYQRNSFLGNIPPAVLNLMIINLLFWLASQVFPSTLGIDLVKIFGLHYWFSDKFNPIQLVTYMFLHDTSSIWHLFCNMFGIWMFGRTLEQVWGAKKFLFFYFFTGIGAGIIQELTWMIDLHDITTAMNIAIAENSGEALVPFSSMFTGGNIAHATAIDVIRLKEQIFAAHVTVGASGALFGILLAFGWLFPEAKMGLLFVPFMIPARIFVAIYAAFELFFGVTGFAFDNVAHFAHLGGMLFGAGILWMWKRQGKLY